MDFHLKQWRDHQQQHQHQQESEEQQQTPSAKLPRLLLQVDSESDHQPALPLFSQPSKINSFSTYPDSKPPLPPPASPTSTRFSSRGGYFSMNQWQELELQALIFRHMVAGAAVPPELLQLVKKSLFNSPSYFLNNNNYSYYQPTLLQAAGYWGRGAMDPEPGRCRRTDGKKWRCSRDVVAGQKYCERHVHRGRNRSRKPVEFGVPTASAAAATATTTGHGVGGADLCVGVGVGAHKSSTAFGSSLQQSGLGGGGGHGAHFSLSGPTSSSLDIFQLNQGASETKPESKFSFEPQNDTSGGGKYNGRVLRRFFDDWPRSDNTGEGDASRVTPATSLSISTPVANSSLDFLKLSTGNGEDDLARRVDGSRNSNVWSGENQVAAMGGPLAEALRSSTGSSPTSVLNQIPRSASETSYVAA